MQNSVKKILAFCFLLVSIGFCVLMVSRQRSVGVETRLPRSTVRANKNFEKDMVRNHMMTMEEAVKFQAITNTVLQTHAISDDDLDWTLTQFNKPMDPTDTTYHDSVTRAKYLKLTILGTLEYVKQSTPQQQDKVFVAVMPLLQSNDIISKCEADDTMAAFNLTRAIPYIQPQLKDPSDLVKRAAKDSLKTLGAQV